jgi:hypothetical protein
VNAKGLGGGVADMLSAENLSDDRMAVAIREPFFIFEFRDLFDRQTYGELDAHFPKKPEFPANWSDRGGKYHMNSRMPEFAAFAKKAPIWAALYDRFADPSMMAKLFELAHSVPSERSAGEKKPWRIDDRPKPEGLARKPIAQLRRLQSSLLGYTPVRLVFEFSYLESECYIPPHTDVPAKLISLMIYFPDEGVEYPVGTGTEFYRGKNGAMAENVWKSAMLEDDAMHTFFDKHEVFYTSDFTPNKLVGFVKTSNSWHGVRPLTLPPKATRRSLNINYYLA